MTSTATGGGIEGAGSGGLVSPPAHSVDAPSIGNQFEGLLHRNFLRSISQGKPIHDGEAYINGRDPLDYFWLELTRGGSAAYAFKWDKRAWDWGAKRDEAGGRKMAELYPYLILDPYAVPATKLARFMTFKRELLTVDDLFVPRQNAAQRPSKK